MSVLLVGANGSMGQRYQAILKFLDVDCVPMDKQHDEIALKYQAGKADAIILATPTGTHCKFIEKFAQFNVPILCEKPLSKNKDELIDILHLASINNLPLSMMLQYEILDDAYGEGLSYYNFFRHGSDGLYWDCLQIIGLARGEVLIHENSPVWTCRLNGKSISLSDMDLAYVKFVENWMRSPYQDLGKIKDIHFKTAEMAGESWK